MAGDSVLWTKALADYSPSDGWVLAYRIVGAAKEIPTRSITTTANSNGGWDVTIPSSASGSVTAGTYRLVGWVTGPAPDNERHVIHDEAIAIAANPATGLPSDLQSPNQTILAAIDAKLAGRVTGDQEQVQINGTSLTRIPMEKLLTLRGVYAAKVWRELHPGVSNPSHELRFRRAR